MFTKPGVKLWCRPITTCGAYLPLLAWELLMETPLKPVWYEISVRGKLSNSLIGAFPGLRKQVSGSETVLAGLLPDQAALYGGLSVIEAFGFDFLEVRRPFGCDGTGAAEVA